MASTASCEYYARGKGLSGFSQSSFGSKKASLSFVQVHDRLGLGMYSLRQAEARLDGRTRAAVFLDGKREFGSAAVAEGITECDQADYEPPGLKEFYECFRYLHRYSYDLLSRSALSSHD